MSVQLLDLRAEQVNPFPSRKKGTETAATSKIFNGKTLERDPKSVIGIGIHQTACVFGPANDRATAHRRALKVPAHAVAFRDGVVAVGAPLPWYLYHGNELNAFTLGLEIEGHYPGLLDDPTTPRREDEDTTWGGEATPLDDLTIETARYALKWLVEQGRAAGMPIRYIWAHRQSNGVKASDPGQGIWKHVVLEYGVPQLGLATQPGKVWPGGKTIPTAWDPNGVGKY